MLRACPPSARRQPVWLTREWPGRYRRRAICALFQNLAAGADNWMPIGRRSRQVRCWFLCVRLQGAQNLLIKLINLARFMHYARPERPISENFGSKVRISFARAKAIRGRAMRCTEKTRGIETRLQHPRIAAALGGEPVTSPIYQSSTYVLPTPELGAEIAASWHPQRFYTRYGCPTLHMSSPSSLISRGRRARLLSAPAWRRLRLQS